MRHEFDLECHMYIFKGMYVTFDFSNQLSNISHEKAIIILLILNQLAFPKETIILHVPYRVNWTHLNCKRQTFENRYDTSCLSQ